MNIVFWLFVIVALVALWFAISSAFREIGEILTNIFNSTKEEITDDSEAEVVRIAAEAEAAANQKIAASLTPELIEKIKYEQWDGKLPGVTGADSIINMTN